MEKERAAPVPVCMLAGQVQGGGDALAQLWREDGLGLRAHGSTSTPEHPSLGHAAFSLMTRALHGLLLGADAFYVLNAHRGAVWRGSPIPADRME
jgi:hypothetical protein